MTRPRPIRDLALAFTLLTVVPLPVRWPEGERTDVASYFALVGLAIGGLLATVVWVSTRFFYGLSAVVAAVVLFALALFTRYLHWDGLADVSDGWWVPKERRLDVMADSSVGAFAVSTIVFVALVQWSALVALGSSQTTAATAVLAPVFGRLAATFSAWFGRSGRPGGLGSSVLARPGLVGVLATSVGVAAACWVPIHLGLPVSTLVAIAGLSLVAALAVPHVIALRFGGVTGDTMGASVLLVETLVLLISLSTIWVLRLLGMSA
jgi:adenosylcobinamide-GDP ribazoletransferase